MDQVLRAMLDARHESGEQQKPLPEVIIGELRALEEAYRCVSEGGCPFRPGQFVTPRPGRVPKGEGEPHVVLEVFDPPLLGKDEAGAAKECARNDMRVACYTSGRYATFMAESWEYEPYPVEGASP